MSFTQRLQAQRSTLRPPAKKLLSVFAEESFKLSPESSAEPGAYSATRCAFQAEMLDVAGDPKIQEVVFCTGSQIGKTTILMIALFNSIANDPAPILLVMPTVSLAQSFSKDRLTAAFRDSPEIGKLVGDAKSRDGSNTILAKQFPGGQLNIVGSNSPSELASRPVRVLLCDEIDRWPQDVGGEGDPLSLAIRRTATFYNRKLIFVSTPTDEHTSAIWSRYEASDQREYYIECQHCDASFVPKWNLVKWQKSDAGEHQPETALLHCPECGSGHTDAQRNQGVRNGKWVQKFPDRSIAGFNLSALHSPFVQLSELVKEYNECQNDHLRLKTFINTILGEVWRTEADKADDLPLLQRVEDYDEESIPNNVSILTAGCDTQKDRMEVTIMGHAPDNEKYVISHTIFQGNPDSTNVLEDIKEHLTKIYTRQDGTQLRIMASIIDSGGLSTQTIYKFCEENTKHKIMAGKGASGSRPIFPPAASITDLGKVFILGVDSAKEQIYEQLRVDEPGAKYIHFSSTLTPDYFDQLTSERKEIKKRNGYTYYQWVLPQGRKNEALDCGAYALAAFYATGVAPDAAERRLQKRQRRLAQDKAQSKLAESLPEPKAEAVQEMHEPEPKRNRPNPNVFARRRHQAQKWI